MEGPENKDEPTEEVLAELSALADGTLDPERADSLRQRIAGSADLTGRYEREQRAVAALAAVWTDRAPARHAAAGTVTADDAVAGR